VRRDHVQALGIWVLWKFQSTRLREARHNLICLSRIYCRFNPRAYVRRDGLQFPFIFNTGLFQSTRREARRSNGVIWRDSTGFQSTRLREARRHKAIIKNSIFIFQSTRLREARLLSTLKM